MHVFFFNFLFVCIKGTEFTKCSLGTDVKLREQVGEKEGGMNLVIIDPRMGRLCISFRTNS